MSKNAKEINDRLTSVLVGDRLNADPEVVDSHAVTNPLMLKRGRPTSVARPGDADQLKALIELANQQGLALVPASSTAPHDKGGTACDADHVIVDLSAWKRIDHIDRRNRVCMVEPGVTYGELLDALRPHGLTVSMPLAPRSGKSVLAAVMDREPSTWPNKQWDVADPLACTEIIFGTGDVFRTGAAGGPGTLEQQRKVGGAQKSPLGPSQTDFHRVVGGAQGAIGVVAWMTMRTEMAPAFEEPRLIGANDLRQLLPFAYEVQRPWIGEHSFILDRTATAMLMTHESHADFENTRNALPEFVLLQNVAGFKRLPMERLEYQLTDITEIATKHGLTLSKSLGLVAADKLLEAATTPCGESDWRHTLRGHCLSLFFLTKLDRAPEFVALMDKLIERIELKYDDIGTYVQPIVQNHGCHLEFMIPFNPEDEDEVERMRTFEAVAVRELIAAGAFFSRPYGYAERAAFESNELNFEVLKKIKGVFDPGRVLNPGKFGL